MADADTLATAAAADALMPLVMLCICLGALWFILDAVRQP